MTTADPTTTRALDGVRVAITADRRGAELSTLLERLGATVAWGSTMSAVPPERDSLLEVETKAIIEAEPTWIAVSTGSGLRAWLQAAEGFGMQDQVEALLRRTRTAARGSKSHGALRALGVEPEFVSPKETMDDICSWLAQRLKPDDVLAAQVHGGEVIGTLDALRPRVSAVLTVAPYRWVLPPDLEPARHVVRLLVAGEIDVLAETSAPSVRNLFVVADELGVRAELLRVLRGRTCVAAVGPVTARAFEEVGVPVDVMPARPRTGDLLRSISHWAAAREQADVAPGPDSEPVISSSALELVPGATAVRIGAQVVRLGRQEFAVLAALVRRPGLVITPDDLALQAWGHRAPDDATQVRHHIARIRRKLGEHAVFLQTVRSVGYRYQPPADRDA
ncbi:uroporphyrinogen-III synthase [Acidothermaceae bacterium B102]|nr:uroporphyrinogen-III synthase [Acidothermaceae bacterium B102]